MELAIFLIAFAVVLVGAEAVWDWYRSNRKKRTP
jgi:hypothetical protein